VFEGGAAQAERHYQLAGKPAISQQQIRKILNGKPTALADTWEVEIIQAAPKAPPKPAAKKPTANNKPKPAAKISTVGKIPQPRGQPPKKVDGTRAKWDPDTGNWKGTLLKDQKKTKKKATAKKSEQLENPADKKVKKEVIDLSDLPDGVQTRAQTLPQFPADPQISDGIEGLVDWCLDLPTLVTEGTKNGHAYATVVFEAIQQGIGATNVARETAKTRDGGWDADIGIDDPGARMYALGSTKFPPTLCEFKFRSKGTIGDAIVKGAVGALASWKAFKSGNSRVFVVSNRNFSGPAHDYAQFQNDRLFSRTFDVELVNHERLKNWIVESCDDMEAAVALQTKVKERLVDEKYFRAPSLA